MGYLLESMEESRVGLMACSLPKELLSDPLLECFVMRTLLLFTIDGVPLLRDCTRAGFVLFAVTLLLLAPNLEDIGRIGGFELFPFLVVWMRACEFMPPAAMLRETCN